MINKMLQAARRATPGPWDTDVHSLYIEAENPYGYGSMMIAQIRGWGHLTGGAACDFSDGTATEIQNDNAAHIASCSPERIIALCEFVEAFDRWQSCQGMPPVAELYDAMLAARRRLHDD